MASAKKKLTKNIFSLGIIQVANYVFPMISIPIISRIIGPEKLGVINFTSSFIAYFILLIGFGFDLTATRRVASDPQNVNNRNTVFSEVFFSQCLLLLFSIVAFVILLFFIPQLREEKVVAIFTFITCFATVMTQNWLFQAMQDLTKVAILNIVSKVIFTAVVLYLVRVKSDYIWQPFALSIAQLVMAIMSFIWAIKRYNLKLYWVKISSCFKLLWDEKVFFFSLCIINIYTNTNIIVLGLLQNSTQVGYYTAAQKLIAIFQAIISIPLIQAIYPYMGKAFGESFETGLNTAQKLMPVVLIFTLLAGLFIWISAPYIIVLLYGIEFANSIIICRILAFIPMIIALSSIMGIHIMLNLKMDKLFLMATSIGAVISILLNIALTRKLGYLGSAYTWTLTEIAILIMLYIILRKKGITVFNLDYFKPSFFLSTIRRIALTN